MKTKLIQALREAARQLSDGSFPYFWQGVATCNCGVLASCIVGRELTFRDCTPHGFLSWSSQARDAKQCQVTGKPLLGVFLDLERAGVTLADICDIEHCKNSAVLLRMGAANLDRHYSNKDFVARYFTAWADMLEEESQPIPTTTQDQIHTIEARDVVMVAMELETVS